MACRACVSKKMQEIRHCDRFHGQIGILTEEAYDCIENNIVEIMNSKCAECDKENNE